MSFTVTSRAAKVGSTCEKMSPKENNMRRGTKQSNNQKEKET
jgi:hypothetical protein